jgi:hypothetical protein
VKPGAPRKTTRTADWAWIFSTLAMAPRSIEERREYYFFSRKAQNELRFKGCVQLGVPSCFEREFESSQTSKQFFFDGS